MLSSRLLQLGRGLPQRLAAAQSRALSTVGSASISTGPSFAEPEASSEEYLKKLEQARPDGGDDDDDGVDYRAQFAPKQETTQEPVYKLRERKVDQLGRAYGTGRRKTSVARVWIKEGSGQFTVNNKSVVEYFPELQRHHALEPLKATETAGKFDIICTAEGGGITGQAGAVRLGLSRALEAFEPELRPPLSRAGMLTRDPRAVERKKTGQHKARKKYQWVKR